MVAAGLGLGAGGCGNEVEPITLVLNLHAPAACAPAADSYAQYYARGDFDPSADEPAAEGRRVDETAAVLDGLRPDAKAIVVDLADSDGVRSFRGTAAVEADGQTAASILLWPAGSACTLSPEAGSRTGAAFTALGPSYALVTGGMAADGVTVAESTIVDLTMGDVRSVARGLVAPRMHPSSVAVPFGAFVSGGRSPFDGRPLASAERFVLADADFDGRVVELAEGRADHGSAVLRTGEVVLVGGVNSSEALVRALVAVDPTSGRVRTQGLAALTIGRKRPRVVQLRSGELLVVGGVDAAEVPVAGAEWIGADGGPSNKRPQALPAAERVVGVALSGGGALVAVVGETGGSIWMARDDGVIEAVPTTEPLTTGLRLFDGADGTALVWTGTRWLRYAPWRGELQVTAEASGARGPARSAVGAEALYEGVSPEVGLALWVDDASEGMRVVGLRFDTRTAFDPLLRPLLADGTAGLAPDRRVGVDGAGAVAFDRERGLVLADGAIVTIADRTFASLRLGLTVTSDTLPILRFVSDDGREFIIGEGGCPWPKSARTAPRPVELEVGREGATSVGVAAVLPFVGSYVVTAPGEDVVRCVDGLAGARVRAAVSTPAAASGGREVVVRRMVVRRSS